MSSRVQTGLEVLAGDNFRPLAGRRVGLVTNPTGVLPDLRTNIEVMAGAPNVKLAALFGPEHGVRGDAPAGASVAGSRDAATGLPVFSLYGRTTVPSAEMLRGLDAMVFDIQDIGSRSYTFLSSLASVMEACANQRLPLFVLDRPNPLGLSRVEGSPTEPGFRSFVGKWPVPYVHGMTLGELAKMANGRGWLPGNKTCPLTVVPCRNLDRTKATWDALGSLPWVPTSPHVPRAETAAFYALSGIVGELSAVSIGVGYTLPFELFGAPGVPPVALARELARRALPGLRFRPLTWTPFYAAFRGRSCGGVQIYLDDPVRAPLTRLNFEAMDAVRKITPAVGRALFTPADRSRMFDLVCGTDKIRRAFLAGANAGRLWETWNAGRDAFLAARRPYLLY